jgi:hypothetical protein
MMSWLVAAFLLRMTTPNPRQMPSTLLIMTPSLEHL